MALKTPVLFIIFNRPDTTFYVFNEVRLAKPLRLYIAADGPRAGYHGELEKCREARNILTMIDWPCEVRILFHENNLGCKFAVTSAIRWFFEHEEMGIVLEDDCLPSPDFFRFCEQLLIRYASDTRIGQISGYNQLANKYRTNDSYLFATGGSIWGWATWRRVANNFDPDDEILFSSSMYNKLLNATSDKKESKHIVEQLKLVSQNKLSTWDYSWGSLLKINSMLSVVPSVNLVKNIGFGEDATHTTAANKKFDTPFSPLPFPLRHPRFITPDITFSKLQANNHTEPNYLQLLRRIPYVSRIYRSLKGMFMRFK